MVTAGLLAESDVLPREEEDWALLRCVGMKEMSEMRNQDRMTRMFRQWNWRNTGGLPVPLNPLERKRNGYTEKKFHFFQIFVDKVLNLFSILAKLKKHSTFFTSSFISISP
jgi:hypothetical protein